MAKKSSLQDLMALYGSAPASTGSSDYYEAPKKKKKTAAPVKRVEGFKITDYDAMTRVQSAAKKDDSEDDEGTLAHSSLPSPPFHSLPFHRNLWLQKNYLNYSLTITCGKKQRNALDFRIPLPSFLFPSPSPCLGVSSPVHKGGCETETINP